MARRSTSSSPFGVSRRENHDARGFYRRFSPPELSGDTEVAAKRSLDELIVGDARHMAEVDDASVALVVTSPPYFAGKAYEEELGRGGVPATYLEFLDLLRAVFGECVRKLEPGGRIAVNVANLGRRPYRSLSADVTGILQDDLHMLLRGEIIWMKQRGASGSCAWGSFQRPGNPVLRDLTERVIVASKGRFDRAIPARSRAARGLPSVASMTRDDFMANTLDVWEIPAESATRVGHPAPFPVELPARLIEMYTYREDLVLDPFSGSGTTAVAAVRTGRHFAGYDLDESYVERARARVEQERRVAQRTGPTTRVPAVPDPPSEGGDFPDRALRDGLGAKEIARSAIEAAGYTDIRKNPRLAGAVDVSFSARDGRGRLWLFEIVGTVTSHRSGAGRSEALLKAVGKAAVLSEAGAPPLILLLVDGSAGRTGADLLGRVTGQGKPVRAVVELLAPACLPDLRGLGATPA